MHNDRTGNSGPTHQPVDADKLLGGLGPGRELHVGDGRAVLHHAQAVVVGVDEHLGQVVELWDQLLGGGREKVRS